MKNAIPLFLISCSLFGCAGVPLDTFNAPSQPISFPVTASSLSATFVNDERSDGQKITQSIREFDTTTLLIGDDFISPAPPTILASRILERNPHFRRKVTLRIFLISVWGRSPQTRTPTSVPIFAGKALIFVQVPMPTFTSATAKMPAPATGYSADLLRVTIEGEADGVTFSAKESVRLTGIATQDQIKQLVESVAAEAASKILLSTYGNPHTDER